MQQRRSRPNRFISKFVAVSIWISIRFDFCSVHVNCFYHYTFIIIIISVSSNIIVGKVNVTECVVPNHSIFLILSSNSQHEKWQTTHLILFHIVLNVARSFLYTLIQIWQRKYKFWLRIPIFCNRLSVLRTTVTTNKLFPSTDQLDVFNVSTRMWKGGSRMWRACA